MKRVKVWLVAIAALLILIVVLQNTQAVETKLLFATVTMPRALLLAISVLIGFILGLAAANRIGKRKKKAPADGSGRPLK